MRCMAVIDLLIIGFACMSLLVFAATQDKHEKKEDVQIQRETDTGN